MTRNEFISEYDSGRRDFSYANLSDANLSGANLRGASLSYANLRYANLRYANLRDANLSYANLSYANLRYANLSGANLSGANLRGANLRGANLISANLRWIAQFTPHVSGAARDGKTVVAGGLCGFAPSSDRALYYLIYEDGSDEVWTGCYKGTTGDLDKRSAEKHTEFDRTWYVRAIETIRMYRDAIVKHPEKE